MPDSGGGSAGLQYQNTAGGITARQGLDAGIEAHEDAVPLRGLPQEDGIGLSGPVLYKIWKDVKLSSLFGDGDAPSTDNQH
jgi:hypothetical protein